MFRNRREMANAYASSTLRHIKGEQVDSDPEDIKEVFRAYIKLVEKMRGTKGAAELKAVVHSGLQDISEKNKVEDEYTKKMFKGFTERVKMLEKKMLAENKRGGRRTTRKRSSRKN